MNQAAGATLRLQVGKRESAYAAGLSVNLADTSLLDEAYPVKMRRQSVFSKYYNIT